MPAETPRSPRRSDALSRERIVEATIELLDAAGEPGLTVRALTTQLATGRGAIYHHVSGKDELLNAATESVIARALALSLDGSAQDPADALRAIALGIFESIDRHPWVGRQLATAPFQPAVMHIWRLVGDQLLRLEVSESALSDAGAALVNYVLGAAAQHAMGPGRLPRDVDRRALLSAEAAKLTGGATDPVVQAVIAELVEHDDRAQFVAGVDIVLAGIKARS